jgi:Tol biopolymer transport system component
VKAASRSAVALLVVALFACQSSPFTAGPAGAVIPDAVGVGPNATFAIASRAGLLGLAADGKVLGHIVKVPAGGVPSTPVLHPDRKRLFFVVSETTAGTGFGSDVWSVNIDGTGLAPVLEHETANVFYASPTIAPAGDVMYIHRREAKDDEAHPGVYLEAIDTIEVLDLATGKHKTIIKDGAEPTIAPDGKTLVFVHMDRGQQAGLWATSTDDPKAAPFLKTGDRFWFLQAPRISPTGGEITWSSAGRSSSRAIPPAIAAPSHTSGARLAHLDIPSELYIATMDGKSLRPITTTGDDVIPAWSRDGKQIAYIALATFFIVNAANGEVTVSRQGIGINYGDPIWLR